MNETTRKHPRSMSQAFGPYCSRHIDEPVKPFDWEDKLVLWGCIVAVVAVVLIGFVS